MIDTGPRVSIFRNAELKIFLQLNKAFVHHLLTSTEKNVDFNHHTLKNLTQSKCMENKDGRDKKSEFISNKKTRFKHWTWLAEDLEFLVRIEKSEIRDRVHFSN